MTEVSEFSLHQLLVELKDPAGDLDPTPEPIMDPAVLAVRNLVDPEDIAVFFDAYVDALWRYEAHESREKEGFIGALMLRREERRFAVATASGHLLTKALDCADSPETAQVWFDVAEQKGYWPPDNED